MARDYRAEYQARVARGAAAGKRPSDAAGQSKRSKASTPRAPRESALIKGRSRVRVVQSSDRRYVQKVLRDAANKGQYAQVYAVWDTDLGYRTQVAGGKQQGHSSIRTGDRAVGKFRVITGTKAAMLKVVNVSGVPARRIVTDLLKRDPETGARVFDTFDDYLGDWWDDEAGRDEFGS